MNKLTSKILTLILIFFCLAVSTSVIKAQVVINEFSSFSYPGDWVELYAIETTDISGWYVRDSSATNKEIIPGSTTLQAGNFYTVEFSYYLNIDKDKIILRKADDSTQVDVISYGYQDAVCAPKSGGSVGRIPDGGNTYDRFLVSTKSAPNGNTFTDPCPTPTTTETAAATETQTATLTQTSTLTSTTTKTPTKKVTPTATVVAEDSPAQENAVLGLRNDLTTDAPTAGVSGETAEGKKLPPMAIILIAVGTLVLGGSGFAFIKKVREDKRSPNEQDPPVS